MNKITNLLKGCPVINAAALLLIINIVTLAITVSTIKAYSCNAYNIDIPESYTTDDKSLDDFTTFTRDTMTIGVRLESNLSGDNISTYTETQIADLASSTIESLNSKAGSGIAASGHELTTFSVNAYPALHMTFEGETETYSQAYMEEYILTMQNYKYTIVFSCNTQSEMQTDEMDSIISSFKANDKPITNKPEADMKPLIIIFTLAFLFIVLAATLVIRYYGKHNRTKGR